ncbi:MAG TPA: hypothetical protein VMT17_03030 [Anaeromyxobacteraceae bacterium]|nr:hypothetical protein [Anaeromyxobacteraceae bacterium]
MSERKSVGGILMEQGMRMVGRAAKAVLDDPRGQEVLASAVGLAQRGRKRLGVVQERVLRAAGLPAKSDYEEVSRQIARLKRKIRELSRQVDAAEQAPDASGFDDSAASRDEGSR